MLVASTPDLCAERAEFAHEHHEPCSVPFFRYEAPDHGTMEVFSSCLRSSGSRVTSHPSGRSESMGLESRRLRIPNSVCDVQEKVRIDMSKVRGKNRRSIALQSDKNRSDDER